MCERECKCKTCSLGPCHLCAISDSGEPLQQCRSGGIKECKYYEERNADK